MKKQKQEIVTLKKGPKDIQLDYTDLRRAAGHQAGRAGGLA